MSTALVTSLRLPAVVAKGFRILSTRPGTRPVFRQSLKVQVRSMGSKAELEAVPGNCVNPDPATSKYIFQQTMYRIKDPERSLDFYTRIMGMRFLSKLDFPDMKFSLYFLGFQPREAVPEDPKDRAEWTMSQPACLELTHNWGTESDPSFTSYHNGNTEPRGFGHIGFVVPDVDAACTRFEELGVPFQKRPNDGKLKGVAFICDPDGYWVEILSAQGCRKFVGWTGEEAAA